MAAAQDHFAAAAVSMVRNEKNSVADNEERLVVFAQSGV
jgi:hypothetical protein